MRIWIDLDNSPHVLFFAPLIRRLEADGATVMVTVRAFSQTEELAAAHKLRFQTVGEHRTPRHFLTRASAACGRAFQLARCVRAFCPDVAVSHGSRSLVLAARILGVPSLTLYDYEFISARIFHQLSARVMAPAVVGPEVVRSHGLDVRKFISYPGFKEEVYVYDFQPDGSVMEELGLDPQHLIVTVRPPAEWAHYHSKDSENLFQAVINRLRKEQSAQVIVLPRTREQAAWLPGTYGIEGRPFHIATHAIDALSLIWYSDAVFSGGGTMVREAALLGGDVYSIFCGRLGSADRALADAGKLKLVRDASEVERIVLRKKTPAVLPKTGGVTRDFVYEQIYGFARAQSRSLQAAVTA